MLRANFTATNVLVSKPPLSQTAVENQTDAQRGVNRRLQGPVQQSSINEKQLPFTQSQLSLALSIQRSKPPGITTRDYCSQLRKHIRSGKPPAPEDLRYIDSAEFWKEQYSFLYLEKKQLETRIARLELLSKENGINVNIPPSKPTFVESSHSIEIFRNFDIPETASELPNAPVHSQPDAILQDLGSSESLSLLKQSLVLYRLLQDDRVPTNVLLSAILSSQSHMSCTLGNLCKIIKREIEGSKHFNDHSIHKTFRMMTAIFNMSLKGLAHLCRDITGRHCKGQVIYSLVHLFKRGLDQLYQLSLHEATCIQATTRNIGLGHHYIIKPQTLTSEYANFLVKVLTCPEMHKTHPSHLEVLEGTFAALLETTGSLLSRVVFREEISSSDKPGRISSIDSDKLSPVTELATEITGQHLALILKQAIVGRSEKERKSLAVILACTGVSDTSAGKTVLLSRAKQRLQETLLKGVFGDDGKEFVDALKMPDPAEGWDQEVHQASTDRNGTFVESVWSAIGWDIILGT